MALVGNFGKILIGKPCRRPMEHNVVNDIELHELQVVVVDNEHCGLSTVAKMPEHSFCVNLLNGSRTNLCPEDIGSGLSMNGGNHRSYLQGIVSNGVIIKDGNCTADEYINLPNVPEIVGKALKLTKDLDIEWRDDDDSSNHSVTYVLNIVIVCEAIVVVVIGIGFFYLFYHRLHYMNSNMTTRMISDEQRQATQSETLMLRPT